MEEGLYDGSVFKGKQKSRSSCYSICVTLQNVDLENSFLCGFLSITGLTESKQVLTTYFEAEIIGPVHKFFTNKWDANEKVDIEHWSQFPSFAAQKEHFFNDKYSYDFMNADHIFMRWKEYFWVPDHRVTTVPGASYEGFYYMCFNRKTSSFNGFYYHRTAEWYQSIEIQHEPEKIQTKYTFC